MGVPESKGLVLATAWRLHGEISLDFAREDEAVVSEDCGATRKLTCFSRM